MDIILWRHADAEDGIPDAKRALSRRGQKQAKKMAKWLRKRLPEKTRVIVSPALRCRQTAEALGLEFETTKLVGTSASTDRVLKAAGWPDAEGTVVVVGHQPTLGQLAARIFAGTSADWNIKKGAAWWFSVRTRESEPDTVLVAAVSPELVKAETRRAGRRGATAYGSGLP